MSVETNSHNYTNMNSFFSQFVAAEFPKTPSPKSARIPPQTLPAGGKSAEAGRIHSSRQIVSSCLVRISSFNHLGLNQNLHFNKTPSPTVNSFRSCCIKLNQRKGGSYVLIYVGIRRFRLLCFTSRLVHLAYLRPRPRKRR